MFIDIGRPGSVVTRRGSRGDGDFASDDAEFVDALRGAVGRHVPTWHYDCQMTHQERPTSGRAEEHLDDGDLHLRTANR